MSIQPTGSSSVVPTAYLNTPPAIEPRPLADRPGGSGAPTALSDELVAAQYGLDARSRGTPPACDPGEQGPSVWDALEGLPVIGPLIPAIRPSGPFESADQAAIAGLQRANPVSISENREYGGLIYKDANGQYWSTAPAPGTGTTFDPTSVSIPEGTTLVGDYHTHADYSVVGPDGNPQRTSDPNRDDYNSDQFSEGDLRGITYDAQGKEEYTGYLGTPSGDFRRFDPATGEVTTLCND